MLYKSLFMLGRQPALGRAELESVLGSNQVGPIGQHAMGCTLATGDINFARFGGSTRCADILTELPTLNWPEIARLLAKQLPLLLQDMPEGKLKLGLSVFGLPMQARQLLATGLELKKVCKKMGRSVRVVPNTEPELSSAQVRHNQLTNELGIEFLVVRDGNNVMLARTTTVQDIEAYAARDQGRPKRDARVGMLPPKLAQIIVNLAVAQTNPGHDSVVLDPFCGTGVILQEATLMGFDVYGSDLEPRMIDFTDQNLQWLKDHVLNLTVESEDGRYYNLEAGDATSHRWQHAFSVVASETYLGRPLSSWPNPETLQEIMGTCNVILEKFLRNVASQTNSGLRLCLALPAWRSPNGRTNHLRLLDHLDEMGYNRISFEHAKSEELLYFRPDQIVARELLVITRK